MLPNEPKKRRSMIEFYREYHLITAFFYELIFVLLGLVILGVYLDALLNTKALFTILLTLLGVFASFLNLYKRMVKKDKKHEDE